MTTKVQNKNGKTIFSKKIERVFLNKVMNWGIGKEITRGHIVLEGGTMIQILGGKFHIVIDGLRKGAILKSSPNYRRIKRLIAANLKTFRKGPKASLIDHIPYFRSRAIDGLHNINLFKISGISFSENKSNFLVLAS